MENDNEGRKATLAEEAIARIATTTTTEEEETSSTSNDNDNSQQHLPPPTEAAGVSPVEATAAAPPPPPIPSKSSFHKQESTVSTSSGVSFGEVRIRRHERILDKRPSGTYAGLELGWAHISSERLLIEDFELSKQQQYQNQRGSTFASNSSLGSLLESSQSSSSNSNSTTTPTCHGAYCTTAGERINLLNQYGYSMKDVIKCEKQKKKELEKRRQSESENSDDYIDGKIGRSRRNITTRSKSPIRRVIKIITRSLSPTRSRNQQQEE